MAETIRPEGIMTFKKHDKAPDFVLGTIVITPNKLIKWLKENEHLMTEYKGEKQIRLQATNGQYGLSVQVDTYKGKNKSESSDLPF